MCYFGAWSVYRWSLGKFDVEDIDPFACTHIMFGFAGLDEETFQVISLHGMHNTHDESLESEVI